MNPTAEVVKPPRRQDRTPGVRRIHVAGWVSVEIDAELNTRAHKQHTTRSLLIQDTLKHPERIDLSVIIPEGWNLEDHAPRQPYRPGVERVHIDCLVLPDIHAKLVQIAHAKNTSVSALVSAGVANMLGMEP